MNETSLKDVKDIEVEQVVGEYHFECAPFLRIKQMHLIRLNPLYKKALAKNVTDIFRDDILFRITNQDQSIISYYGETGSGKSMAAVRTGEMIVEECNSKVHVCFLAEEVNQAIKSDVSGRNDVVMLDERVQEFGVGSGRQLAQLGNIEATLRKLQLHFFYVAPELFQHLHKAVIQMWDIDRENETSRGILQGTELYNPTPFGYVLFQLPSKELLKEYDLKKDKFLEKSRARSYDDREALYSKYAKEIGELPYFEQAKSDSVKLEIVKENVPEQLAMMEYKSILAKIKLGKLKESVE